MLNSRPGYLQRAISGSVPSMIVEKEIIRKKRKPPPIFTKIIRTPIFESIHFQAELVSIDRH
jgi:hypothetical protein